MIYTAFVLVSGTGFNPLGIPWDFSNNAQFGDSFGPISAIMASLAALSAIATFNAQALELDRIKERELESDRRAEKVSFEHAFFQLLQHHQRNVVEIDIDGAGGKKTGQDAFRSMLYYFRNNSGKSDADRWGATFHNYRNDLGHYFRFLYHLVNYVDRSPFEDKYFYMQIVRATLSESELILLGLNCAYGEGREKFKDLVERYSLMHNLSDDARAKHNFLSFFAPSAFNRVEVPPLRENGHTSVPAPSSPA
ncbi:hypothetical protein GVM20_11100 [Porphyrobacter sp. SLTP]|uniref:putative phage abortive infection protein n=1 Tax=Porphyrobacter sp. SLTP TaxID=2683266 RepID=UPI001412A0F3|nr:putative phage abortive infection protein [Porphyrobacter sp. SLTP]NBB25674.1 hypothetical protein [Porphyrobacter sp. SLTP]